MSDVSLRDWLAPRGLPYLALRARSLATRYGLSSGRARRRIDDCVATLAADGCMPTFMVPGRVVQTHPDYLRSLADRGAELALHGFDHVDFKTLAPGAVVRQFERSADAFERAGIPFHGFRCPYLSATDELFRLLPRNLVAYSSNLAVHWPEADVRNRGNAVLRQLEAFYTPLDAGATIVLPFLREGGLVELPCALPDDLQLYDGLQAGEQGLQDAWCRVLEAVHARGELHVVLFHPELADRCLPALTALLARARSLRPRVWLATLRDVAAWWQERSQCTVTRSVSDDGRLLFTLHGSARANLVAGQVTGREIMLAAQPLPLVGISPDAPSSTRVALRNLGYVMEETEPARCTVLLDGVPVDRDLVRRLDHPQLVRVAPWPDGARAALCVSGDLDALSLVDYARRFSIR